MSKHYDVACYHWSNWHPYEENDKKRGEGWTEWEYLRAAIPRFAGHRQPKKPLWGYLDDSKVENAEFQITAAADHGITSFIYVWGWTEDDGFGGHGNNLALEQGFLKAANRDRLQFGLMWCGSAFEDKAFDYIIDNYFSQPNYWRVNGCLYLSVYEMNKMIKGSGGIEEAAEAIHRFREKTRAAGLGEIHLAAIEWGLQDELFDGNTAELLNKLSINSVTSYVWAHNTTPKNGLSGPYSQWAQEAMEFWPEFQNKFEVPYFPHVSMGWDPSPRCPSTMRYNIGGPLLYHTLEGHYENLHEPYLSSIVVENTPDHFKTALMKARKYLDMTDAVPSKVVTIYSWNEWTEGGFLEPEEQYGMAYLEAIKDVFG